MDDQNPNPIPQNNGDIPLEQANEILSNLGLSPIDVAEEDTGSGDIASENHQDSSVENDTSSETSQHEEKSAGSETGDTSTENDGSRDEVGENERDVANGEQEEQSENDENSRPTGEENDKQSNRRSTKTERRIKKFIDENRQLREELARREAERRRSEEIEILTREDFNYMKDENGNIVETTKDEGDLAFYRWQEANQKQIAEQQERIYQQEQSRLQYMETQTQYFDEIQDFIETNPEFDSSSDKFDPELSKIATDMLKETMLYDENGQVIGISVPPTKILNSVKTLINYRKPVSLNKITPTDTPIRKAPVQERPSAQANANSDDAIDSKQANSILAKLAKNY